MMSSRVAIARPGWLVGLLLVGVLSCGALGFAFWRAWQEVSGRPDVVRVEPDQVLVALEQAPWTALEDTGGAPTVWIVSFPACPSCISFIRQNRDRLLAMGLEPRVILYAPRDAPPGAAGESAFSVLAARMRDAGLIEDWLSGPKRAFAQAREEVPDLAEPEVEGLLEWGRASRDRLEETLSGAQLGWETPMVFWEAGGAVKVASGARPGLLDALDADLAAAQ